MKTLDPDSEYYRICRNCGKEFMADNLRREFCDNNYKCHDAYHRREDRYLKSLKPIALYPSPAIEVPMPDKITIYKRNKEFLDRLGVGRNGLIVSMKEFIDGNFDFKAYESRIELRTVARTFQAVYGPYIITWQNEQIENKSATLFIDLKKR